MTINSSPFLYRPLDLSFLFNVVNLVGSSGLDRLVVLVDGTSSLEDRNLILVSGLDNRIDRVGEVLATLDSTS